MRTVKIGVFGIYRGGTFYDTIRYNNGEIVAACDVCEEYLAKAQEKPRPFRVYSRGALPLA